MINSKQDTKKIVLIDTGAGNLFSLQAAIERLGFNVTLLQKPDNKDFDGIVIPGQGRFGEVVKAIRQNNWEQTLLLAQEKAIPILGICVGMQIFFEASAEDPDAVGLGWLKGEVESLNFPKKPMVGWARLNSNLWPEAEVYFVNSFAIRHSEFEIATTTYGDTFCAAIRFDRLTGVQFHPEKSSVQGSQIIQQALSGFQGESK